MIKPLPEINALPVFKDVQLELISLLHDLSEEEWYCETSSTKWNVKDIVAHLLDGDLRRLSIHRDKHTLPKPSTPIEDYTSLVGFLNDLNNTWVTAAKRLSPSLLTELIKFTTPKVVAHLNDLDPNGIALFSVDWAGEKQSENWFDIAREYTEKWHHQQQIREALGKPLLVEEKWLTPLINTLIRGVPPVYNKHTPDTEMTSIKISISGEINNHWWLINENGVWQLYKTSDSQEAEIEIEIDDDTAWRIFTKNISEEAAMKRIKVKGNQKLGSLITKTVSFMK